MGYASFRKGLLLAFVTLFVLWAYGHDVAQRERPTAVAVSQPNLLTPPGRLQFCIGLTRL
jgi:hypothetical protein